MNKFTGHGNMSNMGGLDTNGSVSHSGKARTLYHIECYDSEGRLKWVEDFENLVTTVGFNKVLDSAFKTGVTSPTWFVGLVDNASFSAYAAGDTMSSHSGWIEGVPYSNSTRVAFTPSTPASGSTDNSAAKAVFNINATLTIRGAFLVDNSTKSGTTGTLYGEGDFSVARSVISGDTLNVQVTISYS